MNFIVIAFVLIILVTWALVSFFEWLGETSKQAQARWSIDTNKNIIDRNQETIQKFLNRIYTNNRGYYIDNEVKSCIAEVAQKEGRSDIAPNYREWLSKWETRNNIPQEYLELKKYLKELFLKKYEQLSDAAKKEEEQREQERIISIEKAGNKLIDGNSDLINKFLEIAERKVSVIDDYGDENWDVLSNEILACIKKIALREGISDIDFKAYLKGKRHLAPEYGWLKEKLDTLFREYHEKQGAKPSRIANLNELSGIEFEAWVAKLLKENGFDDVRGTSATGDQGADLIVRKDGRTIVIQAKRYQGTVGNKAVQEVISAVQYYGVDEGWVITNSTFTSAAKKLAYKSNVKLIDGKSLEEVKKFFTTES